MRHIWTMIAAIVIAPLAWLLLAYGQDRSLQAFANQDGAGGLNAGDFTRPVLCLAGAGLLLGLIATLRFSPLGAVLTGLVYTASYLALLVDPDAVLDLLPSSITLAGRTADPSTPLRTGATLLLGALLLVAVVSVNRWRRWPDFGSRDGTRTGGTGFALADDRPLGVEGLGLTPVRNAELVRVGESSRAYGPSADAPEWPTFRRG